MSVYWPLLGIWKGGAPIASSRRDRFAVGYLRISRLCKLCGSFAPNGLVRRANVLALYDRARAMKPWLPWALKFLRFVESLRDSKPRYASLPMW